MNRLIHTYTISLAAMLCAPAAFAQQSDFDSIISEVLAANPQLAADSLNAKAEVLDLASEGNLPDPEISFDHKWPTLAEAGTRWGIEVSQSFDWPGVYSAKRRALEAARDAETLMNRSRMREKALEARLLLIDIVDANLRAATLAKVKANMDSLLSLTRERFNRGDVTILTLKKIEFERFTAESTLSDVTLEQDKLRADLAAMAGGRLIDTDALTEYPSMPLRPESDYLKKATPAIEAMHASLRSADQNAKAARLKRWPGFSVGYLHEFEEGVHFNGFSVGLTLPLFSTRHQAASASARSEALAKEIEQARLDQAATVRSAHSEASRLKRRAEAYQEVFGADDYLSLLKKAFDKRQLTAHEYLGEVNDYLSMYLDHLATIKAYHQALVKLESLY